MKLYFLIIFLSFISLNIQAQNCGTTSPSKKEIEDFEVFKKQYLKKDKNLRNNTNAVAYLPIKVHIIRNSDGTGGLTSLESLNQSIARLNQVFLPVGVQFYFCGSGSAGGTNQNTDAPHYINNSTYNTTVNANGASTYINIVNTYNVANAINIYVLDNMANADGFSFFASTSSLSNVIFVKTGSIVSKISKTLIHEFGHYFNLYHTFENSINPTASLRELSTRGLGANCATTGDRVCDTPADPYAVLTNPLPAFYHLSSSQISNINNTCSYNYPAILDINGQAFTPSITNTMSYWSTICGLNNSTGFTSGQYERMKIGYAQRLAVNNQYILNCAEISQTPPSALSIANSGTGAAITWTDNSSIETGFFIERAESVTGDYICIGGVAPNTTTFVDNTISSDRTYYYRVRYSNAANFSGITTFISTTNYCLPTYVNQSCITNGSYIARFSISTTTLNNNTSFPSPCNANNYSNFTGLTPVSLNQGQSYTFILKGSGSTQHFAIWIDANKNGSFESNEILYQSNSSSDGLSTFDKNISIIIPTNALAGQTRIRIRTGDYGSGIMTDACSSITNGETEDYLVNIIGTNPLAQVTVGTISSSLCASQTLTVPFTTTGTIPSGTIYTAELSDKFGNFINVSQIGSGTASPITCSIPALMFPSTNYRIRIITNTLTLPTISNVLSIFQKPEATVTVVGASTVCSPLTVNLNANSSSGYSFQWKKDGVLVTGTEQTFTATETGQYSLVTTQNACSNESYPVAVTINPALSATISGNTSILNGQSTNLTISLTAGTAPYSFQLSDGQVFTNLSTSPYSLTVSPNVTTNYTITSLTNAQCGNGSTIGTATITVNQPQITTNWSISSSACQNTQISVPFTSSNFSNTPIFGVQLVNYTNSSLIYDAVGDGTSSPLNVLIPNTIPAGIYKVRVKSLSPSILGAFGTAFITINITPSAPNLPNPSISTSQSVLLSSSGCSASGQVVRWYSTATSTALLAQNVNYQTPVLSATTTYYALCMISNTACMSPRAMAIVTYSPCPQNLNIVSSTLPPFQASDYITTSGTINYLTGNRLYKAGKSITITPPTAGGFWQSDKETVFEAKIEGCQ